MIITLKQLFHCLLNYSKTRAWTRCCKQLFITQTLTQAVQTSLRTCPNNSLWDPPVRLRDKKHRWHGTQCASMSLGRHLPKFSDAVLTAPEASGVHANRHCNPAQGKYWHKLGESLHVYLLWTVVKPFPVAPASSGWQSWCARDGLLGLYFELPEVCTCTTLHLLSLTASSWAASQGTQDEPVPGAYQDLPNIVGDSSSVAG